MAYTIKDHEKMIHPNQYVEWPSDDNLKADFKALCAAAKSVADVTEYEILSHDRHRCLYYPRMCIASILRNEGYSLMQIGRVMNRNHSVILYAVRNMDKAVEVKVGYEDALQCYDAIRSAWMSKTQ